MLKLLIQSTLSFLCYAGPFGDNNLPVVGGQRDSNNCLISAGFSWCESSQLCIRQWETPCDDNYNDCSDCLRRQINGENIACPQECNNAVIDCLIDDDCGDSHFCRPVMRSGDAKECYAYSKEGDTCGGYTLPMYESRCPPTMDCVHSKIEVRPSIPMIEDSPGICMHKCPENTYRNEYGSCVDNHVHNLFGDTYIAPQCNGLCPPPPPCPPPGPDCEYGEHQINDCGCIIGCGEINCMAVGPIPQCPQLMCLMYCENGNKIDGNGCNICECNTVTQPIRNECPIPYEDCENEYVCPKVTEITHCSEGGIEGTTTYQLSLVIKDPNVQNIYALYGDNIERDHQMIIPEAYQVHGPFRSNIGGVSNDVISLSRNSRYDSWLTIGITDGDLDNKLGTIGIDFESWELNTPLVVDNGAVFTMDPEYDLNGLTEVVVGQLTIPTRETTHAIMNVQGKLNYDDEQWRQFGVVFSISPPVRNDNSIREIPHDCISWFDGCNTCRVNNGVIGACTRVMCFREDTPYCILRESGH